MEYILHLIFTNILYLIFTNILWYTKATEHCENLHAQLQQSWAHCDQLHEHHNAHWREHCVVLSTLRTVFRCIALMRTSSHVAQVSSVCLHFHPWSSACALVLECSLHTVSLLLSQILLPPLPEFLPWCLTRIPWKIRCATPVLGAWSAWTMSHPTQWTSRCCFRHNHGFHWPGIDRRSSRQSVYLEGNGPLSGLCSSRLTLLLNWELWMILFSVEAILASSTSKLKYHE